MRLPDSVKPLAALIGFSLAAGLLLSSPAGAAARTWYVQSGARAGGTGAADAPFPSLQAVQAASQPGDTIVVAPVPSGVPPLDGGIALKPGQSLVGGGPAVAGNTGSLHALPVITNSTGANLGGDAVRLADASSVRNLVVRGAYRGGVYGTDVKDVTVAGNDLSGTNMSCTTGFVVQPFQLPTSAPGVGIPFSSGLPNGWAAIMIDETHTDTSASVVDNAVHDADCADGIDMRASGTAGVRAQADGNRLADLKQGSSQQSVLAIGMQSTGTAHLQAEVNGNTETYIGTATAGDFGQADSEGLFANSAGRSRLTEQADGNTFAHGLGHLSANCVEVVASNGGPTMTFDLTNSTCNYVVGDILEAANLSRDSNMALAVDHVIATHSTYAGGTAQAQVEPGDDGDCVLEVASGAASSTAVSISNSQLSDCAADGLGAVSNVVDGSGPVDKLSFDIENSRVASNQTSNVRVENITPITELDGKAENSDLSESPGTPVLLENRDTSGATHARLDLGGGALGSAGHNCILGGEQTDVTTMDYDVAAEHDWWGAPGGPGAGATLAVGGTIDSGFPLAGADCGPAAGTRVGPGSSVPGPSTPGCVDRRAFTFTLHHPRGQRIVRARVLVNGRQVRLVRGRHISHLTIGPLPAGQFTVTIHTLTNRGTRATSTRAYTACTKTPPRTHFRRGRGRRARRRSARA